MEEVILAVRAIGARALSASRRTAALWPGSDARPLLHIGGISLILTLLGLAAPLFAMLALNRVLAGRGSAGVLWPGTATLLAYGGCAALEALRRRSLTLAADMLVEHAGAALLRRATAPLSGQAVRPATALMERDLDVLRQFAVGPALPALIDLPFIVVFLLALAFVNGLLAALAVLCVGAQAALAWRAVRSAKPASADTATAVFAFGEALTRHADCASTMNLAAGLTRRWHGLRHAVIAGETEQGGAASRLAGAARFLGLASRSLMLVAGAILAHRHAISLGAVFAGLLLLGRALAPVENAASVWRQTATARAAWGRMGIAQAEPAREMSPSAARGELVLEAVAWTPPGAPRPALRGVTLKIEAGAFLAVIGPSAAGKSTLARVFCGALRPDHGTVKVDGIDIGACSEAALGAAIGYLPQDVALFPGTVAENIGRFGNATQMQIVAAAKLGGAHDMILELPAGYATMLDENAAMLSAGQRQRVALARALLGDPPVLVLDEPDASLDAEGEAALICCMIEARRRRRTVIIVTHNTGLVRVADFVATMVGGHVMKVQRTADVLGRPAMLAAAR